MTEESKFLSYASVRLVKGRVDELALAAMALAVCPLIVDALLTMESAISSTGRMRISDLDSLTIFAFFQIAMQIAAAGICAVARRQIREAPQDYYRMRWVGTLAAWVCYGILLIEGGVGFMAVMSGP